MNGAITSVIKTETQYNEALQEIDKLMNNVESGTPLGNKLELLILLVSDYEDKHYSIPDPDPIEAIKFRMEQLNMTSKNLGELLGYKERASEILNRKRRLTLDMIRKISTHLGIPSATLIKEYELQK